MITHKVGSNPHARHTLAIASGIENTGKLLVPSRDEAVCSSVYFTAYLTHRPDR